MRSVFSAMKDSPLSSLVSCDWRLNSRESFKSDQLRLIRIGKGQGSWKERNDPENRASSLARLSPRLPRRREFMRHLFVVDSLDKRIQNEKELIHLASAGGGGLFFICVAGRSERLLV